MIVYYVLMATLSLCSFTEVMCYIDMRKTNQKKMLAYIAYLSFFLVLVLHNQDMGVDSENYHIMFNYARSLSWTELFKKKGIDYGYYVLNKLIGYFTQNFWLVRCVIHVLTILILFFVIDRKSKYPATSVLLYAAMCNIITYYILREALAVSLCFLAYYFLEKGHIKIYLILVLIAASLHITAILGFVFIICKYIFKRKITFLMLMSMSVFLGIAAYFIVPHIMVMYQYGRYKTLGNEGGFKLLVVLLLIILFLSCYIKQYKLGKDKNIILQYNLICCSVFIQICALYSSILTRARYYVAVFMILLIPNLLNGNKNIGNKLVYVIGVICASWIWLFYAVHPFEYFFQTDICECFVSGLNLIFNV